MHYGQPGVFGMCVCADRRSDGRVDGRVFSAADYDGHTGDPVI